jgi:hypothetical protein
MPRTVVVDKGFPEQGTINNLGEHRSICPDQTAALIDPPKPPARAPASGSDFHVDTRRVMIAVTDRCL